MLPLPEAGCAAPTVRTSFPYVGAEGQDGMTRLVWLSLSLTLITACREKESVRLAAEARERRNDAGSSVGPQPANAELLASGQNSPRGLHADATHLYWFNEGRRAEGR